jgi:hypothetical protein
VPILKYIIIFAREEGFRAEFYKKASPSNFLKKIKKMSIEEILGK